MNTENKKSPFAEYVLITIFANGVISVMGLVTGMVTARLLGPNGRGELAAIQMWANFVSPFATLGLPEALVYFAARSNRNSGRYLTSAAVLSALAAVPLMAATSIIMPALLAAEPARVIYAARWYLLVIPLSAIGSLPAYCLRGLKEFGAWNCYRVITQSTWLLVLAVAYFGHRVDPEFLAAGCLVSAAVINAALTYFTVTHVTGSLRTATEDWRPMLRFGLPTAITATPLMLNLRLDQMIMGAFLPARVLGLYVVAVAYSGIVQPLVSAIGVVHFPNVAAKPEWRSRVEAFAVVTRLSVLVVLLLIVFFTPLAQVGIAVLFGRQFLPATTAAKILVPAAGLIALNFVLEEGLRGLGASTAVMWAEFGGLPITAVSLALLLKPLGIVGAAVSSLMGYGVVTVLLLLQAKWLTGWQITQLFIARKPEFRLLLFQAKNITAIFGKLYVSLGGADNRS